MSLGLDQYIFLENSKKIYVGRALQGEHVGAGDSSVRRVLSTHDLMSVPSLAGACLCPRGGPGDVWERKQVGSCRALSHSGSSIY